MNVHDGRELKEIVFFDARGEPATHWSGVERWTLEHDEFGNVASLLFRDASGRPKNGTNGYATIRYEWAQAGRFLAAQEYRDAAGRLVAHPQTGAARIEHVRDEHGLVLERLARDVRASAFHPIQELKQARMSGRILLRLDPAR